MGWEDVAWNDIGGDSLTSHSYIKNVYQSSDSSWLLPVDRDSLEEQFDVEGDMLDFDWAKQERTETGLQPTHFPISNANNLNSPSKSIDQDFTLFPSYEEPTRRDTRAERIALANDPDLMYLLDDTIPQESVDDTYLQHPPTEHVDYLTHQWEEEDVCASWRKIVADRQGPNDLQARLENASWRSWTQMRLHLDLLPAETIHWTKDEDVTWLYGPLHKSKSWLTSSAIDKRTEAFSRKSSLKKPCLEDILLRCSVSPPTLPPSLASSETSSQAMSRAASPVSGSLMTPPTSPEGARGKAVSFHEVVSQCIAVSHEVVSEGSLLLGSGLRRRLSLVFAMEKSSLMESISPSKTIHLLPSTTLKPAATTPNAKERVKSWPSRTLSYLWGADSMAASLPLEKTTSPYLSPPLETRSYFEDDDGNDDESHWNPPRPRKLPGVSTNNAPLPQECKVMSSFLSSPVDGTAFLSDEESFEAEMFGFPLTKSQSVSRMEEALETQSARSSPSISDYLSSSSDDSEELESKKILGTTWAEHDSKSSNSANIYSQTAESLNRGLGFLGATATAGLTNLFSHLEQASSTVVSTVTKERVFNSTCSSEFNAIYRTNNNNFAVQKPAASDFTSTDDEEHWWMNV